MNKGKYMEFKHNGLSYPITSGVKIFAIKDSSNGKYLSLEYSFMQNEFYIRSSKWVDNIDESFYFCVRTDVYEQKNINPTLKMLKKEGLILKNKKNLKGEIIDV